MIRSRLIVWSAILAITLAIMLLSLIAAGRALAPPGGSENILPINMAIVTPSATPFLPATDAAGLDLLHLPRFPGAMRIHYDRSIDLELVTTSVEYMTSANLRAVHIFYRTAFQEHNWTVVDLDFSPNDRYFFVVSGTREATVELRSRDSHVAVVITLSEWFDTGSGTFTAPIFSWSSCQARS